MKKTITSLALCSFSAAIIVNAQSNLVNQKAPPGLANGAIGTMKYHNQKISNLPQTILYDSIYYWTLDTVAKAWDFSSKEVNIIYNAGNKITSNLVQNWNDTLWVNFTRDTYQYNANNLDTTDDEQAWTGSAWENEYHYTFTYNASDSVTSETEQIWTGSAWRNYKKYVYTYDAHNNQTSQEGEQWNGSAWTYAWLYSFTFNANNLKTEEIDSSNVSSERLIYNYNAHNLLISDTSQYWDNTQWAEDFNYGYAYNANSLDTSEVMQQLNGNTWENSQRSAYKYDANNNNIGYLYQNWSNNAWVRFQQYVYTYNVNNIMQSEEERQYYNGGNQVLLGDSTYWYSHKATNGVQQLSVGNGQWSVYPNPGSGVFYIQSSIGDVERSRNINSQPGTLSGAETSIHVYNTLGEKIYSKLSAVNYPTSIDLSAQPNGVYFITLKNEQGIMNGKIVIQR